VASTFKNQGLDVGVLDNSTGNMYTAPGGTYAVVHALYISNNHTANTAHVNVKVTADGGSTFFHVGKSLEVDVSNTLILDKPINLEPGDILRVYADPTPDSSSIDVEAFASILEVT
tara:strand:- start:613 stop:960 length:348 start_codon:yes stop_codon:yes gene_type:complete